MQTAPEPWLHGGCTKMQEDLDDRGGREGAAPQVTRMSQHLVFGTCKRHWKLQDGRVADMFELKVAEGQAVGLEQVAFVALVDGKTSTYFVELIEHGKDFDLWEFITRAWSRAGMVPYTLNIRASDSGRLAWLEEACRQSSVEVRWVGGDWRHGGKTRNAESNVRHSYWEATGRPICEGSGVDRFVQPKFMGSMREQSAWRSGNDKPLFGEAGAQEGQALDVMRQSQAGPFSTNESDVQNQDVVPAGRVIWALSWLAEKAQLSAEELAVYERSVKQSILDMGQVIAREASKEGSGHCDLIETISGLMACWPETAAVIARRTGMKLSDLKMALAGRQAITMEDLTVLRWELGIGLEDRTSMLDGSTRYGAMGCYVLFASGAVHKVVRAYEALSRGGDVEFAAEVTCEGARVEKRRRLVLMLGFKADALLVIERGSRHERLFRKNELISLAAKPRSIPYEVYEDLIAMADSKHLGYGKLSETFESVQKKHGVFFEGLRSEPSGMRTTLAEQRG